MGQMHIEQLYQHIISIMTKDGNVQDFSFRLAKLQTNSERIEFVYDLLSDYKVFPNIIVIEKECIMSDKYRNLGNEFFRRKVDERALDNYNNAILYAPNNSRELALGFANRSAVLFSYKLYKECIDDIDRALMTGYDESLKPKILKRKSMCEEAISEQEDVDLVEDQCRGQFKLSKEPHPLIPCASKSIEISYSREMGRSVVAADNIAPGEVLAVEQPYCCILLEAYYLKYCYGCLKQCFSMIPCQHCCHVMFCCSECRDKAWQNYHRMECKLMPLLSVMKFTKLELLALRTVIQTKCNLSDWELIHNTIQEADSVSDPQMKGFTKVNSNFDSSGKECMIFDSRSYVPIHTLVTNVKKRSMSDIFQKSVTAAVCLNFLMEYSDFFSGCTEDSNGNDNILSKKNCVYVTGGLLLHHNMTGPSNMHTISSLSGTKQGVFVDDVNFGGGAFAFLSLLNHSCAQNVVRYCSRSSIALVALRPIKKGQQLFDNYG